MAIVIILAIAFLIYYLVNKTDENYQKVSYVNALSGTSNANIINSPDNYVLISNYDSYCKMLEKVEECSSFEGTDKKKFEESYFDTGILVAVECAVTGQSDIKSEVVSVEENDTVANIKMSLESSGYTTDVTGDLYFIPVSKNIQSAKVEIEKIENDNNKFDIESLALSE